MSREIFPVKHEGDRLGAEHVNNLSRVARRVAGEGVGSGTAGHGGLITVPGRVIQRTLKITGKRTTANAANWKCDDVAEYQVQPLWFNSTAKVWQTDTEEEYYCLDVSAFPDVDLEIGDVIEGRYDQGREMFVGIPATSTTTDGGGGGTSSNCCCEELNCIQAVVGVEQPLKILYYSISLSGFFCGCTSSSGSAGVALYQVSLDNPYIWEQKHGPTDDRWMCTYPNCTATAKWKWNGTGWDQTSITGSSCGTPSAPDFTPEDPGDTTATATTTFSPAKQVSFWRLTIVPELVGGCDQTKLEFFIGEDE